MRSTRLAEFGIRALRSDAMVLGTTSMLSLIQVTSDPEIAGACLAALGVQLHRLEEADSGVRSHVIRAWHRSNKMSLRLNRSVCPGIGADAAAALVAHVAEPKAFRSGRNFSAWIGLVPKRHYRAGARTGSGGAQQAEATAICAACSDNGKLAIMPVMPRSRSANIWPWLTALLVDSDNHQQP